MHGSCHVPLPLSVLEQVRRLRERQDTDSLSWLHGWAVNLPRMEESTLAPERVGVYRTRREPVSEPVPVPVLALAPELLRVRVDRTSFLDAPD
jgi:hypothetical protein